jgi:hypothetical protein
MRTLWNEREVDPQKTCFQTHQAPYKSDRERQLVLGLAWVCDCPNWCAKSGVVESGVCMVW